MTEVTMTWKVVESNWAAIEQRMMANAAQIVAKTALDWEAHAKTIARAKDVYEFGTLINSIQAIKVDEHHWRVIVGVEYGAYNEYGTVHMAARPFFGPAGVIVRQAFLAAMKHVMR